MNSLLMLRKSASPSPRPVTLAALTSSIQALLHKQETSTSATFLTTNGFFTTYAHNFTSAVFHSPSANQEPKLREWFNPNFGGSRRKFHLGPGFPLNFRSSTAADISDEEKTTPVSSSEDGLAIANLGISQEIVSALARKGITKLFPIQQAVLKPAMQGRDMIGRARTGTGKTLAFGIPIMDKIIRFNAQHGQGRNPLALILAPTRELARQVDKEFLDSAPNLDTLCVYGGVPIQRQMSTLDRGVDVIVGTPGRVIDLIKRGALNLAEVQFVVLDEADQMLNVGFAEDVEIILERLPKKRQSMMFSATMPSWIMKLTHKYLNNPLTIDLVGDSDRKLADGISLYSIVSEMHERPSVLGPLITEHAKGGKCIVFTQTKRDADRLAYSMQKSLRCEALHGDISQNQRERTLKDFRDGHFNVLVATDVAARGLDVPNVDLVIHFELPNSSEIFVHRSGRTGRAGKKGSAILIYSAHQSRDAKGIEREVGCKFIELPKIAVEGGSGMFSDSGRNGSFSFGNSGVSRYGDSGFGRSRGGRFSELGFDRSSGGRSTGYGGLSSGRVGGFGANNGSSIRSGGGFGTPTSRRLDTSGGNGSDRFSRFGGHDSSDRHGGSGRFGGSGDFGSRRYSGIGGLHSRRNGELNDNQSNQFGGNGFDKTNDNFSRGIVL